MCHKHPCLSLDWWMMSKGWINMILGQHLKLSMKYTGVMHGVHIRHTETKGYWNLCDDTPAHSYVDSNVMVTRSSLLDEQCLKWYRKCFAMCRL